MQDTIRVVPVFQGDYPTMIRKVLVASVSNIPPVLAAVEISLAARLVEYHVVEPLNHLMQSDTAFHKEDLIPSVAATCIYDDSIYYAIPSNRSVVDSYYNKDLFRAAGLDPEKPPETWNEVYRVSRLVKEKTGQYGISLYIDDWDIEAIIWSYGEEVMSPSGHEPRFNDKPAVAAFELLQKMVREDIAVANVKGDNNAFNFGHAAMTIGSSASYRGRQRDLQFDWAQGPYPIGKKRILPIGGADIFLFKDVSEEKKRAAWTFMKYWLMPQSQWTLADSTGYIVSTWSVYYSDHIQNMFRQRPDYKVAYNQTIQYGKPRPRFGHYNEINDHLIQLLNSCIGLHILPHDALQEGDRLARKIIATYY
jgi:sn-glycerol 3-phosphate transport system substrate-binding protein